MWFQNIFKKTPAPKPDPLPNTPSVVKVTGNRIEYFVPSDMKHITVHIKEKNGRLRNSYVLTDYVTIHPTDRVEIVIDPT